MRHAPLARTLAAALPLLLFAAAGACADANLNCDAYAGAAVAQNKQNISQGCGFTGGRWSSDFAGHRAWCLAPGTHMADLTAEDQARQQALAQCAAKPKADQQACQTYAKRAVMVAQEAARRSCGFKGGRWTADYGTHFDWCLDASQAARDQEDKARTDQLDACIATQAAAADKANRDACSQYATTAVGQQKENQGRQCGFTGTRWAGGWKEHFDWCMSVGPETAGKETAIRVAALRDSCMQRVCTVRDETTITPPFFKKVTSCRDEPKPWK
jgi:hypothetical protein